MKRGARLAAVLVLSAVFIVSAVNAVRGILAYKKGAETYAEAEDIANVAGLEALADERPALVKPGTRPAAQPAEEPSGGTEEQPAPESTPEPQPDPYESLLREANVAALQEINGDVKGWIVLPGTGVSYPLLQGGDNEFYLNHDWKRDASSVGAVFLDYRASDDFTDFNAIAYGHRMRDRSMFGRLKRYAQQDYLDAHPDVYVRTADTVYRYAIYAAYEADVTSLAYCISLSDEASREEFIRLGLENSAVSAGFTPQTTDRFLTLVTCTGSGYESRWVVQAVLAETSS